MCAFVALARSHEIYNKGKGKLGASRIMGIIII